MIAGTVNARREAVVGLALRDSDGNEHVLEAVVDTGFDGWLTLPPDLIKKFGFPRRRAGRALLADGSESLFDIHEGIILWDKTLRRIPIDATETMPLIGMALLAGCELKIEVESGGRVVIRPLRARRPK